MPSDLAQLIAAHTWQEGYQQCSCQYRLLEAGETMHRDEWAAHVTAEIEKRWAVVEIVTCRRWLTGDPRDQ